MAQFTKVQDHQCLPKADHLTWEEAAAPTLTGGTAYRMLFGWPPHTVQPGDVVLVWGGSGGLGSLAIQLVANAGGRAVAVVSLRREGRVLQGARRGRLREPDGLRPLGRAAGVGRAGLEGMVRGREGLRQGDLGRAGREDEPADRVRAPRPGHDPDLELRVRPRRHDRDLRRHLRLRHDDRRALPLVPAEALPGLAPDERRAGGRVQRSRPRGQDRRRRSGTPTATTRSRSRTS